MLSKRTQKVRSNFLKSTLKWNEVLPKREHFIYDYDYDYEYYYYYYYYYYDYFYDYYCY